MTELPKRWRLAASLLGFWALSYAAITLVYMYFRSMVFPYSPGTSGLDWGFMEWRFGLLFGSVYFFAVCYIPLAVISLFVLARKQIFQNRQANSRTLLMRLLIGVVIWLVAELGLFLFIKKFFGLVLPHGFTDEAPTLLLASGLGAILLTVIFNKAKPAN